MLQIFILQIRMRDKDFLNTYLEKLTQKVKKCQQQWKGTRYAAIDESDLDPEDQDQNQYEQFLQKYRGKSGNIKPLGLILYHKYLRSLFILFLALTLLFVPVTMVYSFGEGLSQYETSSFSKSTLLFSVANLPNYRLDDLSQFDLTEIDFYRYLTLTTDIIAICVVFAFLIYMKIQINKITNHYMAKCPSPHLYCLQVTNIQGETEERIFSHFSKLGKISQLSGVYSHQNTIYDLSKIVKLVTYLCSLKPDQKRYEQIYSNTKQKIRRKYFELAENYLRNEKPKLKSAFICFQQIPDRNRVYDLYKYQINPKKLDLEKIEEHRSSRIMTQQSHRSNQLINKQSLDIQQTKIHLSNIQNHDNETMIESVVRLPATKKRPIVTKCKFQPLTINWQNCDIDEKSQKIKFFCQFILLVVVAFVILIGLFLLNINSSHVKQSHILNTQNKFATEVGKSKYDASNKNAEREKYTFCASLRLSQFKLEYYNLCAQYFEFQRNKFMLMLTFSLMVAVINLLTNRILWALVAFRRYRTLAERNHFLISSIFLFSVINSAILTLLIRGEHTGTVLRTIVGKILNFSEDVMQVTVFSQFNRQWYLMIGSQLMMNYIVSLVIFPNFHIVLHWVRSMYRKIMNKHSQKQMKKPVFNYCTFYAMSLKAIFFSLIYSNSMPVFYLLCSIALVVQMIVGKFLMKYFVEQPVFVDNNAIEIATNIIPYALLLHCITSILFLNVEQIFPTTNSYYNIHNSWEEANLLKLQRGFVYIIFIIFISVYIWNRERIDKIILKHWFGRTQSKFQCDLGRKFKEIKVNPAFLASYKMKDNPKYKILHYALHLFSSHIQKIRVKGGLASLKSHESLDISNIYTEQQSQNATSVRNNIKMLVMPGKQEIVDIDLQNNNEDSKGAEQIDSEVDSEEIPDEECQKQDKKQMRSVQTFIP